MYIGGVLSTYYYFLLNSLLGLWLHNSDSTLSKRWLEPANSSPGSSLGPGTWIWPGLEFLFC